MGKQNRSPLEPSQEDANLPLASCLPQPLLLSTRFCQVLCPQTRAQLQAPPGSGRVSHSVVALPLLLECSKLFSALVPPDPCPISTAGTTALLLRDPGRALQSEDTARTKVRHHKNINSGGSLGL